MPTPNKNEKRSHFISRCIPQVMNEGYTQDQAVGRCYGIWSSSKKKKIVLEDMIQDLAEIKIEKESK